jgi:DNA ligase (NAD+)
MAGLLADHFRSIEQLQDASVEGLRAIGGVGPAVAEAVHDYFQLPESRRLIQRLLAAGVNPRPPERREGPLEGKTFVITGTLASMTRGEAEEKIKALGGSAGSSVTRNTDYLVVGNDPGSKLEKARRLKVSVLDEAAFLGLLAQPTGVTPSSN